MAKRSPSPAIWTIRSRWRTRDVGIPVDYNPKEGRYNWELLFCEMYAGGKYNTNAAESYEFSLGLNGLGLCSTQYASEYHGCAHLPGRVCL